MTCAKNNSILFYLNIHEVDDLCKRNPEIIASMNKIFFEFVEKRIADYHRTGAMLKV